MDPENSSSKKKSCKLLKTSPLLALLRITISKNPMKNMNELIEEVKLIPMASALLIEDDQKLVDDEIEHNL